VTVPLSAIDLVPKVKSGEPVVCGCFCYTASPRRNEGCKKEFGCGETTFFRNGDLVTELMKAKKAGAVVLTCLLFN
jgi:hypothetical protein